MKLGLAVSGLILLVAALLLPGVYGIFLAFKASIILGIIVLIVQPSPTVLGWVALFGRSDVCERLAAWLHLPF